MEDAIATIVTALGSGAAAAAQETASQAIKDGYANLKGMLKERFADSPTAQTVLTEYETKPDVYDVPMRHTLAEHGLGEDASVIEAATNMFRLLKEAGVSAAASGNQSFAIGAVGPGTRGLRCE